MSSYMSLDDLRQMPDTEVRQLYRKEWKNFRRRMERFGKDDVLKDAPVYLAYKNKEVVSMSEADKSGLDLRKELNQLMRYSSRPSSSISTARKSVDIQVSYYKEMGYDFVNRKNVFRFQAFLEQLRKTKNAMQYDSDDAARLFGEGERLRIKTTELLRHYDEFAQNIDLLESKPDAKPSSRARSIKDVRRWKYEDGTWQRD